MPPGAGRGPTAAAACWARRRCHVGGPSSPRLTSTSMPSSAAAHWARRSSVAVPCRPQGSCCANMSFLERRCRTFPALTLSVVIDYVAIKQTLE
eukprot:scaffold106586_cov38-Prasinocladus_malaysianus.AAC.1